MKQMILNNFAVIFSASKRFNDSKKFIMNIKMIFEWILYATSYETQTQLTKHLQTIFCVIEDSTRENVKNLKLKSA